MYAIVKTGGKQYKVTEGLVFETELLDAVQLDVVLAADGESVFVGEEAKNVNVTATVVEHGKSKKINIFTYKAKKNVRHRQGHRQPYTKLKVNSITIG